MTRWHASLTLVALVMSAGAFPDVVTEDAARFTALLGSPVPERRIEGLQGLADLKHWRAEQAVLPLLDDLAPAVRRAAVLALGRLGGARTVPRFIALLDEPSWELRQQAWLSLSAMTARNFAADDRAAWQLWSDESTVVEKVNALLSTAQQPSPAGAASGANPATSATPFAAAPGRRTSKRTGASSPPAHPQRREALRALSRLAMPEFEESLLSLLRDAQSPPLETDERAFLCEALERAGSVRAVPVLAAQGTDAAAWALGHIGGPEAERALLSFAPTLPVALALDRLQSTNCGPLIPHLVGHMGQITFRSQPDDVMNEDLQPVQRVGANLIRRSGMAESFIERVVQELEDTMKPPLSHGPRPACPPNWERMFTSMRSELKPGFVREDGTTTSQPVVAMCYLLGGPGRDEHRPEPSLVPRLIPLLRHPAVVPRVYVALALGRLQVREALPPLLTLIREGYPFSDSTALASGKHFDQSQTVRWRGFLCLALGRMGGDEARTALEELAVDPAQPRDIRHGAVAGLRFIGSAKSLPALSRIAERDVLWLVRDEARQVAHGIQLFNQEARR